MIMKKTHMYHNAQNETIINRVYQKLFLL